MALSIIHFTMFLQRVYEFFSYIREKIFGICENAGARNERRCSWILRRNDEGVLQDEGCAKSYLPVSDNDYGNGNENENQCVVFFDSENGMMYNKL